jgi:hypothetical protein
MAALVIMTWALSLCKGLSEHGDVIMACHAKATGVNWHPADKFF